MIDENLTDKTRPIVLSLLLYAGVMFIGGISPIVIIYSLFLLLLVFTILYTV